MALIVMSSWRFEMEQSMLSAVVVVISVVDVTPGVGISVVDVTPGEGISVVDATSGVGVTEVPTPPPITVLGELWQTATAPTVC